MWKLGIFLSFLHPAVTQQLGEFVCQETWTEGQPVILTLLLAKFDFTVECPGGTNGQIDFKRSITGQTGTFSDECSVPDIRNSACNFTPNISSAGCGCVMDNGTYVVQFNFVGHASFSGWWLVTISCFDNNGPKQVNIATHDCANKTVGEATTTVSTTTTTTTTNERSHTSDDCYYYFFFLLLIPLVVLFCIFVWVKCGNIVCRCCCCLGLCYCWCADQQRAGCCAHRDRHGKLKLSYRCYCCTKKDKSGFTCIEIVPADTDQDHAATPDVGQPQNGAPRPEQSQKTSCNNNQTNKKKKNKKKRESETMDEMSTLDKNDGQGRLGENNKIKHSPNTGDQNDNHTGDQNDNHRNGESDAPTEEDDANSRNTSSSPTATGISDIYCNTSLTPVDDKPGTRE